MHREGPVIMALTAQEAAAALRISKTQLYDLIRTGQLNAHHIRRSLRISTRALQEFQTRLEAAEQGSRQEEGKAS
jgi:excisionase family DNA binding protein